MNSTPVVDDTLAFLLAHMPPALHVVTIGRKGPLLPPAKMGVRGELAEVRGRDLKSAEDQGRLRQAH